MAMNPDTTDEIDLQDLIVKIIRYFQRYLHFITLSTLIGVLIGLGYYSLRPSIYESKMIVVSDILTASQGDRLTESLSRLILEKNDSILAERLSLAPEEARGLTEIEFEAAPKDPDSDKTNEVSTFIVTVGLTQKSLLPKLQDGLINYLRNNEFVKTRVRQRVETYKAMIASLDVEIKSLDSLKSRLFQEKPIYSKSAEMVLLDPTNIYDKIIELNKQRLDYQNYLELFNSIQLIEGFTPFQKPANPKLSVSLMFGLALGFLGALAILTLKKLFKMAKESDPAAA